MGTDGGGNFSGLQAGSRACSARAKAGPGTGMSVWHKHPPCRPGVQVPVKEGACQTWMGGVD